MSGPKAPAIELSEKQREVLLHLARQRTARQHLVERARLILHLANGANIEQTARHFRLVRNTVVKWRRRWLAAHARLRAAEADETTDLLPSLIEESLSDQPRPGAPPTFSAEQVAQIIALACEDPPTSQRPVSHWTPRELADEAVKRQIVTRISPRQVGRFLKGGRVAAPPQPLLAERQAGAAGAVRRRGRGGV